VYKLWEGSWEDDALIIDPEGMFADPSKIHRINHKGPRYSVEGPHLVEPSPQRTPVLFQAGASEAGRNFAARHAEGIFVNSETPLQAPPLVADIRRRVVEAGRQADDVQIIVGVSFVVGSTEEEAWAKANDLDQYVDREAAMVQASGVLGVDFASADPDMPLKQLAEQGDAVRGFLQFFIDSLPNGADATVADMSKFVATRFRIVGTPETIADQVEIWAQTGIDGFNIIQWDIPGSFADFSDYIAPELQRRGLMKREYAPGTLRERLFPGRGPRLPERHRAAGYREMFKAHPAAQPVG
jgi:FMN-dependent oxidoreductase (nitrilotriacetate monooxygenase family)